MSIKKAVYVGSFDPFTNGHLGIVEKGLKLFDEITILIALNSQKQGLIPSSDKLQLIRDVFAERPRVAVETWPGLVVEYLRQNNISFLMRGLRPTGDFEFEFQMAAMNKHLGHNIETVFFTTSDNSYYISSSLVREVYLHGGKIDDLVPPPVSTYLSGKRVAPV
jgi:pantetheine-phosphate adenylyltransferase